VARPREFDETQVLDKITTLFWEKGYESTSLDDVFKATGIQKGSLYSCFGNKEKIFRMALNRYAENGPFHSFRDIESPLQRLSAFYTKLIADAVDQKRVRRGCFVFNSCLEFANGKDSLSSFVQKIGCRNETFFHALMNEAQEKGEISKKVSAKSAAERAHATAFTIREMSKFKPNRAFLADIANAFFDSVGAKESVPVEPSEMI